ncbi:hypothetical protein AV530_013669 [Patagioenas fasciata monilis]|uniref:Uncharacterized protein n=1 Tax=Patagioenas fasciata monilis TaxID=372326 RepID=A0A1V4J7T1_PATFA|nr:hypothetical protein AV530_013669 [Patagioenas fasciata monilis]
MGNEISHQRYCRGESGNFERLTTEQRTPVADPPVAQAAPGAVLWSSENHPPEEKSQDAVTGMQNEDVERENEIASSSLPVAQIMVRITELQDLGEIQPSAEQSETENKPVTPSPDTQTCAPAQESPAAAQQAEGATGLITVDLPLQTPTGAGDAEDAVTEQAAVEIASVARRRTRCKPSPVCRWLKKLRSPAEKAQVKPKANTSKE